MKKALLELIFIIVDLDRNILEFPEGVMSKKNLIKLHLLKGLRYDLSEALHAYRGDLNKF